ncbi:MAG: helix-turn-helix transcriptional regulator, partial [Clostridia bacterium]|nr:helix-turn-helix transcriptional regulator [Clostridia bacterium]
MRKFAERLKELRAEHGLSILALGKEIGVSDATICRWENGISDIKSDELIALADFFSVSTDDLLGYEGRFHK